MSDSAYRINIQGIVQGVGFRPFVYRLASKYKLKGWVLNSCAGVLIEIEGNEQQLNEFASQLVKNPPPLAVIKSCSIEEITSRGFKDFEIKDSEDQEENVVMTSPDIAICEECKEEVANPGDRRFKYPFINCTNCGPRFTIIKDLPYDRAKTTMAEFPMCPSCRSEYYNPLNRRFHAQPNACPVCGPHTTLLDRNGQKVDKDPARLLEQGHIIAVTGLGAFHLATDAANTEAVLKLRARKRRDAKPFAVMARDIEIANKYCEINLTEKIWLTSPQAPIVVLKLKENCELSREAIHPGIDTIGVMLPYTPLHFLLFNAKLELLIMTSANISDEPLITDNNEVIAKLSEVADYFLIHNREIYNSCDDSVLRITRQDNAQFIRRARGFVPMGISIPVQSQPVLALGGEMKNTFCITRRGEAYLSQHWGDLNYYHNYKKYLEGVERFKNMLVVEPCLLVHDLHPNYQTTRWAQEQHEVPRLAVQHHYAHMASAMADNKLNGEVLGLICDGTGWGTDGAAWGCEILKGDYRQFNRLAHLKYMPLPGGDLTAYKPYRMAFVYLMEALGEESLALADQLLPLLSKTESNMMLYRRHKGLPEIQTSSCGRLFDAVAALLGVCSINKYEGQAAMELEAIADQLTRDSYSFSLEKDDQQWLMDIMPMWHDLLRDIKQGVNSRSISRKFHLTLVEMFGQTLIQIRNETGLNRVVLSGGVFHNQILLNEIIRYLSLYDFMVYQHQQVPPGDGGISLGQAVIGSEVKARCV